MSLSTLLSDLFSDADTRTELPDASADDGEGVSSVTVVRECRHCGTNVSAETAQCPTCESDEIITYSIE